MESWFWMVIVLFRSILAELASAPRYTVHHKQVSFDQAAEECTPGVLTTLSTEQEVANVLGLVSNLASTPDPKEFTFWVGLRKVKNECVVPTLPLRGFKWMEDGSEESQVSRWTEEPKHTCTTVRCAALKGELEGLTVTRWGLIPVSCKNSYQFICKLRDTLTGGTEPESATPEPPKPATPESHAPATPRPPKPVTPEPQKPRPATPKPEPTAPEPELSTGAPEPDTEMKPKTEPDQQGPDPDPGSDTALGSDSCQRPIIPGARSLSLDPDNSTRIQVECWSSIQLELHCSGHPTVWRLLDGSPANFRTVCQPCAVGFRKDASGNCVDIDECGGGGGASCRHTCLNTEGSYRCVCSNENGKQHDEDSPVCMDMQTDGDNGWLWGILIPVLVAMAVLVVLVVVVTVTVKCCLMRRSKKHAMKKAEKMAMRSKDDKDSFETANDKVAT